MRLGIWVALIWLGLVFAGTGYSQEDRSEKAEEGTAGKTEGAATSSEAEKKAEEQKKIEGEDLPGVVSLVEEFYQHHGFALFHRSPTFSLTNDLRNRIFYDSNVFLTEEDEEDDVGYIGEFLSKLQYKPGRLHLEMAGGFHYEHYFDHGDLDEILPRAALDLQYEDSTFYAQITDNFARNSTINTLELRDRSAWYENSLETKAGLRYKRWLVEAMFFHTYVDYRKVRNDYLFYGGGLRSGYQITRRIYLTAAYRLELIDYREATVNGGKKQQDTDGHDVSAGIELLFTRSLVGRFATGVQFRDSETLWSLRSGLTWYPYPKLTLGLELFRGTIPTIFGDYKVWTSGTLTMNYLFTPELAVRSGATVTHSNPENGNTGLGFYFDTTFTYRVYEGIQLELFYNGEFTKTDQPAGDYDRHRIGGSIVIVF